MKYNYNNNKEIAVQSATCTKHKVRQKNLGNGRFLYSIKLKKLAKFHLLQRTIIFQIHTFMNMKYHSLEIMS